MTVIGCPQCDTPDYARDLATFAVLWALGGDDPMCRILLGKLAAKHHLSVPGAPLDVLRRVP